jgi:hypothetical protein
VRICIAGRGYLVKIEHGKKKNQVGLTNGGVKIIKKEASKNASLFAKQLIILIKTIFVVIQCAVDYYKYLANFNLYLMSKKALIKQGSA